MHLNSTSERTSCNGGNGYDRLLTGSCSTLDIDRIEEVIVSFGTVSVGLDQIDDLERIRGGSSTLVQLESFESWTRSTLTANFFLWTGPNGEELWIHQNCYVTDLEQ